MKKAHMLNIEGEKMAATEYAIDVVLKSDEVIELSTVAYSFEDVFEYVKEYFEDKNDEEVSKIVIEVIK